MIVEDYNGKKSKVNDFVVNPYEPNDFESLALLQALSSEKFNKAIDLLESLSDVETELILGIHDYIWWQKKLRNLLEYHEEIKKDEPFTAMSVKREIDILIHNITELEKAFLQDGVDFKRHKTFEFNLK